MEPEKKKQLRGPGTVFLVVGLVFLAVGASMRQSTFLTMGPSMIALGVAFIATARRRAP